MNETPCDLVQKPDGSWDIQVMHVDTKLVEMIPLGVLSKEQAVRETMLRGFTKITCWDKSVVAEIQKGTVYIDKRSLMK